MTKDRPIAPASVARYLEGKFGDALPEMRKVMGHLAGSLPPARLAATAFRLYKQFRPNAPAEVRGWDAEGRLDLGRILALGH